ncbi:MAG: glycosyltransferase family 2 protein [Candidatus Aminicenantes bacterium]|nr:glycosyltransferase family 2 protein [Candidatus Aminicenantes bacterium]
MNAPLLSVILVYYDDRMNLTPCLDSVLATPPDIPLEVILVDNASTDGGIEDVATAFPSVRILRNAGNLGFGAANNRAVRESSGEFLLFLNTDTILQPGAVSALLAAVRPDAGAVAAGPLLFPSEGKVQVSFGSRVDFLGQLVQKTIWNPFYKRRLRRHPAAREAGWLSAACFLCRRSAFEATGGFDEGFFLYFEDIDLCVRMRSAGGRLLFVPAARVFHEGSATTGIRPAASRFEYRKSQWAFYRKHASRGSLRLLRAYLRGNLGFQKLIGRFRGEEGRSRWTAYRELLKSGKGNR